MTKPQQMAIDAQYRQQNFIYPITVEPSQFGKGLIPSGQLARGRKIGALIQDG